MYMYMYTITGVYEPANSVCMWCVCVIIVVVINQVNQSSEVVNQICNV